NNFALLCRAGLLGSFRPTASFRYFGNPRTAHAPTASTPSNNTTYTGTPSTRFPNSAVTRSTSLAGFAAIPSVFRAAWSPSTRGGSVALTGGTVVGTGGGVLDGISLKKPVTRPVQFPHLLAQYLCWISSTESYPRFR